MSKSKPTPTNPGDDAAPQILSFDRRLSALADAKEELNLALTGFEDRFEKLATGLIFPQAAMEAMLVLEEMQKRIATAVEKAGEAALAQRKRKGAFEHGRIAITFKTSDRTTVPWKDVAAGLAKAEALRKNGTFVADTWEADMKTKFGKTSESTSVKLTVSE